MPGTTTVDVTESIGNVESCREYAKLSLGGAAHAHAAPDKDPSPAFSPAKRSLSIDRRYARIAPRGPRATPKVESSSIQVCC